MNGLLAATKCLGCGELFFGSGECPDCVRLDALYESRRVAKKKMLDEQERAELMSKLPRTDIGVVFYAGETRPHLAPTVALLLGAVVASPLLVWGAWHYGVGWWCMGQSLRRVFCSRCW